MNGDKVFIDTNIFVYAKLLIESDAHKRRHAIDFLNNLEKDAVISTQVINEFSSVLLKQKVNGHIIRQSVEEIVNACFVAPVSLETVSGLADKRTV